MGFIDKNKKPWLPLIPANSKKSPWGKLVTKKSNQVCNNIDLQTQSWIDNKIQLEKPIYFYYEDKADAGLSTRIKFKKTIEYYSRHWQHWIYITLHGLQSFLSSGRELTQSWCWVTFIWQHLTRSIFRFRWARKRAKIQQFLRMHAQSICQTMHTASSQNLLPPPGKLWSLMDRMSPEQSLWIRPKQWLDINVALTPKQKYYF